FNATDQTALSLTNWAVQNRQLTNILLARWWFYQTSPWDAGNTQGFVTPPNWTNVCFDGNGNVVPFTQISHSSLSTTAYAVWTASKPAWTQNAPPTFSMVAGQIFEEDLFLVWAAGGSKSNNPGNSPWPASGV